MQRTCPLPTVKRMTLRLVAVATALSVAGVVTAAVAQVAPTGAPLPSSTGAALTPPADRSQWLGSMSVGHPHHGYLFNAVKMPPGEQWIISNPDQAWGTEETIQALIHCIGRVNEQFPNTPKAIIGSISARHGGRLPPHKSHRTGRDVDLYFYLTKRTPKVWYEKATAENLDRPRNWAVLRALITETDVDMILIDRSVKALLSEYALSADEDPEWIKDLFEGGADSRPLIKHVPGHTGHMHIRFSSPIARQRGRDAYPRLVEQGHIPLPTKDITHEVVAGDTLSEIAEKYDTTVEAIQKASALESTVIKVGQILKIRERLELRGALDPIIVPKRRLPPEKD